VRSPGTRDAGSYRRLVEPFLPKWDALVRDFMSLPLTALPRDPLTLARFGLVGLPPSTWLTRRFHDDPDDYDAGIRYVAEDHDATLVKIADNAHNSLPERVRALAEKWPDKPPVTRYADARPVLYSAVPREEVQQILERINPHLLAELDEIVPE